MMKTTQETIGVPGMEKEFLLGRVIRFAVGISLALVLAGPAVAQYGGGGMGTGSTGTGSTGSATPSYGSGKAIGIGVGVAAAGAGVLYLALHHGSSVTGCVQSGDDGLSLVDEKNKKPYVLLPGGADVKPGERVELKGKKAQAGATRQTFQAKKIVKNLGACGTPSASADELFRSASLESTHDSSLR
jgi:hypothetical protein